MNIYEFEIALSFAGEDRETAEKLFFALKKENISVFYDKDKQAELWGKNLFDELAEIYEHKAKYCVILISQHYKEKAWTNVEKKFAQARDLEDKGGYILPLKLDKTEIQGISKTIGYINYQEEGLENVIQLILKKLREESEKSGNSPPNSLNVHLLDTIDVWKNDFEVVLKDEYVNVEYVKVMFPIKENCNYLFFSKYPVTNKNYNEFIKFLNPKLENKFESILKLRTYRDLFTEFVNKSQNKAFIKYIDNEDWHELMESRLNAFDEKYKHLTKPENKPVVGITQYDALAYCYWQRLLNKSSFVTFRLPYEKEWKWAAYKDEYPYPWMWKYDEKPFNQNSHSNHPEEFDRISNKRCTDDVTSRPRGATEEGILDLVGNIWEWQMDNDPKMHRPLLRGGAWYSPKSDLEKDSYWVAAYAGWWDYGIGFRLVLEPL